MKVIWFLRNTVMALVLGVGSLLNADTLYSEGFDSEEVAKVSTVADFDTEVTYVDYSSFTIGEVEHSIPEAPNQIPGSAATRGVVIRCNLESGSPNGVNITAADAPDGDPITFSGNYTLKYDMYLSLDPGADRGSAGTTEVGIWGIGTNDDVINSRFTRNDFLTVGTWGWVATEGGFGTEDAIFIIDTFPQEEKLGDLTSPDLFASAFPAGSPILTDPNNSWVAVEVTHIDGNVTVKFNGVTFFDLPSEQTEGFAMFGYEDPFGSLTFSPDYQFGLFDNFVVQDPPTIILNQSQEFTPLFTAGRSTAVYSIRNNNTEDLVVSAVNLGGDNADQFMVGTELPLVIAPETSKDLEIVFNPNEEDGDRSATMEIVSNDANDPMLTVALTASKVIPPVLLAHFKFDEAEGTDLIDSSDAGADGGYIIRDDLLYSQDPLVGGAGSSIGFTAADEPATGNLAIAPVLHVPTISVSLWIKPEAFGSNQDTLFNRDPFFDATDTIYGCYLEEDVLNFRANGEPILVSDFGAIPDDEVHHVVITHLDEDGFGNDTATRTRMYIDGELVEEAMGNDTFGFNDYPGNAATTALHIGSRTAAGSGFTGLMDDMQIYSVELTADQVAAMFAAPGTLASFGDTPDFEVTDIDVNGNVATLTWNSRLNRSYIIEVSKDFEEWMEIADGVESEGSSTSYTTPDDVLDGEENYFRIREEI